MIIRKADIPESELHLCSFFSSHHVKKVDVVAEKSVSGRWALDAVALNTNAYKEAAIKRYGKVVLPTLESILVKWLCFAVANNVALHECRMMKDDINAAFPQFDFTPESAMLLGVAIAPGLMFFYLQGMFGWTGCPMVFGCLGRAMNRYIQSRSNDPNDLFVDDFQYLSLALMAVSHQQLVHSTINGTFPNGVSQSKCVNPTTRAVVLGWDVDFDSELVKPNEAGCEKLLFFFLTFDTSCRQSLVAWQRLASLAERYSNAISGMQSLVQPLHKVTNECKEKSSQGYAQ